MFLRARHLSVSPGSFPRIRGDVPGIVDVFLPAATFSPHTRGCSQPTILHANAHIVFPAYAGMFLSDAPIYISDDGFPRIRGDVPRFIWKATPHKRFSPHTRGCSHQTILNSHSDKVFPAYAGMFHFQVTRQKSKLRFPRIRGDVP